MEVHDWSTRPNSTAIFPSRPQLTDEQRDEIRRYLYSAGVDVDIFASPRLPEIARQSRYAAVAIYAAIKYTLRNEMRLTRTFAQWSRDQGLPWT